MSNSYNLMLSTLGANFRIEQYFALIDTEAFRSELKKDLELIDKEQDAELKDSQSSRLFEEHAQFIVGLNFHDRQKTGLEMWLSLLETISKADSTIYDKMHKGTAYYHTGIMYLLNSNWLDGFEWLDYAFEQDTRPPATGISELPATWTLSFDTRAGKDKRPNDFGMTTSILTNLNKLFDEIKKMDNRFNLNVDYFRNKIKSRFLDASSDRSVRSAWCSFLGNLMNRKNVIRYIGLAPKTRSVQVSAHRTFVDLTLILETMLKKEPSKKYSVNTDDTLGDLINKIVPRGILGLAKQRNPLIKTKLRHDYTQILEDIKNAELVPEDKLAISYQLALDVRNHSHHLFNEELISTQAFNEIFIRIGYSIIITIERLY